MKQLMLTTCLVGLAMAFPVGTAYAVDLADGVERMGEGVVDAVTSPGEIVESISEDTQEHGAVVGTVTGTTKGAVKAAGEVAKGAAKIGVGTVEAVVGTVETAVGTPPPLPPRQKILGMPMSRGTLAEDAATAKKGVMHHERDD